MKRVFVRGLSRSGGTLMTTILDAHPELAMSYEIYEHLLTPPENCKDYLSDLISKLSKFSSINFGQKNVNAKLNKFISRASRSGVTKKQILELLVEQKNSGLGLNDFSDRMFFIERIALVKASQENKSGWGAKILSVYEQIYDIYPDSFFLFMLRDGRDIAASRKNVGNFNQTIQKVARSWLRQTIKFEKFISNNGVHGMLVRYENLAKKPKNELKKVLDFLGLPWNEKVLKFYELNLTIHQKPEGHLSGRQIKSPINTESIGRWKKELDQKEIDEFESIASKTLKKYGYLG
jgi:hypothetical protein